MRSAVRRRRLDPTVKTRLRPAFLVVALACASCAANRGLVTEEARFGRSQSITLKGGGHAEVKLEELARSYWTDGGWFAGAGGDPPRRLTDSYWVVTGTRRTPQGRALHFGWIGLAHPLSYYFVRPGRLILADGQILIEYTLVPTFKSGRYLPPGRTPFGGDPRLLVKQARFVEARPYRQRGGGIDLAFSRTYNWPVEYVWEEVSAPAFEEAARSGDVIDLAYDLGRDADRADAYAWFARRVEPDTGKTRFLRAVKAGDAAAAEELLEEDPELIHAYDSDGETALHLAVEADFRRHLLPILYRFDPPVNAVNFRGETPLHAAASSSAGEPIRSELIEKGGRILHPSEALLLRRERYGLPPSVFPSIDSSADGWIGDDAYQVRVECPVVTGHACNRLTVLAEGEAKMVRELRLSGARGSSIGRTIGWILDNVETHRVEYRVVRSPSSSVEVSLVRIHGPNLRGLVDEYHAAGGR